MRCRRISPLPGANLPHYDFTLSLLVIYRLKGGVGRSAPSSLNTSVELAAPFPKILPITLRSTAGSWQVVATRKGQPPEPI